MSQRAFVDDLIDFPAILGDDLTAYAVPVDGSYVPARDSCPILRKRVIENGRANPIAPVVSAVAALDTRTIGAGWIARRTWWGHVVRNNWPDPAGSALARAARPDPREDDAEPIAVPPAVNPWIVVATGVNGRCIVGHEDGATPGNGYSLARLSLAIDDAGRARVSPRHVAWDVVTDATPLMTAAIIDGGAGYGGSLRIPDPTMPTAVSSPATPDDVDGDIALGAWTIDYLPESIRSGYIGYRWSGEAITGTGIDLAALYAPGAVSGTSARIAALATGTDGSRWLSLEAVRFGRGDDGGYRFIANVYYADYDREPPRAVLAYAWNGARWTGIGATYRGGTLEVPVQPGRSYALMVAETIAGVPCGKSNVVSFHFSTNVSARIIDGGHPFVAGITPPPGADRITLSLRNTTAGATVRTAPSAFSVAESREHVFQIAPAAWDTSADYELSVRAAVGTLTVGETVVPLEPGVPDAYDADVAIIDDDGAFEIAVAIDGPDPENVPPADRAWPLWDLFLYDPELAAARGYVSAAAKIAGAVVVTGITTERPAGIPVRVRSIDGPTGTAIPGVTILNHRVDGVRIHIDKPAIRSADNGAIVRPNSVAAILRLKKDTLSPTYIETTAVSLDVPYDPLAIAVDARWRENRRVFTHRETRLEPSTSGKYPRMPFVLTGLEPPYTVTVNVGASPPAYIAGVLAGKVVARQDYVVAQSGTSITGEVATSDHAGTARYWWVSVRKKDGFGADAPYVDVPLVDPPRYRHYRLDAAFPPAPVYAMPFTYLPDHGDVFPAIGDVHLRDVSDGPPALIPAEQIAVSAPAGELAARITDVHPHRHGATPAYNLPIPIETTAGEATRLDGDAWLASVGAIADLGDGEFTLTPNAGVVVAATSDRFAVDPGTVYLLSLSVRATAGADVTAGFLCYDRDGYLILPGETPGTGYAAAHRMLAATLPIGSTWTAQAITTASGTQALPDSDVAVTLAAARFFHGTVKVVPFIRASGAGVLEIRDVTFGARDATGTSGWASFAGIAIPTDRRCWFILRSWDADGAYESIYPIDEPKPDDRIELPAGLWRADGTAIARDVFQAIPLKPEIVAADVGTYAAAGSIRLRAVRCEKPVTAIAIRADEFIPSALPRSTAWIRYRVEFLAERRITETETSLETVETIVVKAIDSASAEDIPVVARPHDEALAYRITAELRRPGDMPYLSPHLSRIEIIPEYAS